MSQATTTLTRAAGQRQLAGAGTRRGAACARARERAAGADVAQAQQLAVDVVVGDSQQRSGGAARADLHKPVGGIVDRELGDRRDPLLAVVEGIVAEPGPERAVVQQKTARLIVLVLRPVPSARSCSSMRSPDMYIRTYQATGRIEKSKHQCRTSLRSVPSSSLHLRLTSFTKLMTASSISLSDIMDGSNCS
jgi:hypothetical protein